MILGVYVRPTFSILGLLTNILSIIIIRNEKSKKSLKNEMYRNIFFSSMFNFIFCLINSLSLINVCIFPPTSFCSSVYKTTQSHYFKIIVTSFLGNTIRICCNVYYILFSLSRFSIISSKKFKLLDKVEKIKPLKLYPTPGSPSALCGPRIPIFRGGG